MALAALSIEGKTEIKASKKFILFVYLLFKFRIFSKIFQKIQLVQVTSVAITDNLAESHFSLSSNGSESNFSSPLAKAEFG